MPAGPQRPQTDARPAGRVQGTAVAGTTPTRLTERICTKYLLASASSSPPHSAMRSKSSPPWHSSMITYTFCSCMST